MKITANPFHFLRKNKIEWWENSDNPEFIEEITTKLMKYVIYI